LYPLFLTVSNKAATIREYIPEWQSCLINISMSHVRIFILLSTIYLVGLLFYTIKRTINKSIDTDDIYILVISLMFIMVGIYGIRYIAISSMSMTVSLVYLLKKNEFKFSSTIAYKYRYLIPIALISFTTVSAINILDRMLKINLVTKDYHAFLSPHDLVDYIDKYNIDTTRTYLHYRYGAYLAWKWHGNKKVFIHSFVQDPDLFREYINAQITDDGLNYVVNKYDINTIVLPPDVLKKFPIGDILKNDRRWKVIYKDFQCVMYSKVEV